ncbi:MAG: hypothetical protein LQ340_003728 [Diploschistes diacapsis]|nr:MAG: hypothetical protein LQ340_003728 [Diploschistes diacapsis]
MQHFAFLSFFIFTFLVNARSSEHYASNIETIKRSPVNDHQLCHEDHSPFDSLTSLARRTRGEKGSDDDEAKAQARQKKREYRRKLIQQDPGYLAKGREYYHKSHAKRFKEDPERVKAAKRKSNQRYEQKKLRENPNYHRDRKKAYKKNNKKDVETASLSGEHQEDQGNPGHPGHPGQDPPPTLPRPKSPGAKQTLLPKGPSSPKSPSSPEGPSSPKDQWMGWLNWDGE